MAGHRELARNHDFGVLWVGQTVSELGSQMSLFVFPLLTYHLTGSTLLAALAEGAHLLGLAGALLPAGVLADRMDRRLLMRAASGTGLVLYLSLAVAGVLGMLTLPHLLVVALLGGVTAGVFAPAEMSAVRCVVPSADLPTALSQNQARRHLASLVGGPLGGALYAVTRWLPFALDAVSYAVSWVLLGRLRTDLSAPAREPGARRHVRADLVEGFAHIRRSPLLRVLMVWSALANLAVNALFFTAILRLVQAGFAPYQIGLVETVAGTCGLLGAAVAPSLINRFATGRLTIAVAWSFVPLIAPMVVVNNPAAVAAALGIGVFLNPAGNAGIQSYRIAMTPAALQGRVQSCSQFVSMSTLPIAPLLGGLLLAHLGGEGAMVGLAAFTVLVALVPTLSRSVRAVPRPEVWRTTTPVAAPEPALG